MTGIDLLIAHAVKIAVIGALAGIAVRRRHRLCMAFVGYLLIVLAFNVTFSFWPDLFNASTWMLAQAVLDCAKVFVALDLAYRAFRAFPGAMATAKVVLLIVLSLTTLAVAGVMQFATGQEAYKLAVTDWHPRIASGTIWLLAATAVLVVWYHLPVHPFQRAILLGFVVYLSVFTSVLNLLQRYGWQSLERFNIVDGLAYFALTIWWVHAAWRPMERLGIDPVVLRRLRFEEA